MLQSKTDVMIHDDIYQKFSTSSLTLVVDCRLLGRDSAGNAKCRLVGREDEDAAPRLAGLGGGAFAPAALLPLRGRRRVEPLV